MKDLKVILLMLAVAALVSCKDDNEDPGINKKEYSAETEEWYPGGKTGTTWVASSKAFRQTMGFIDENPDLFKKFMRGEKLFEKSFVSDGDMMAYTGLGPAYIRKSCIACHPSYGGHGQRVDKFDTNDSHNCYLLMIYDPASPTLALASKYFTGMTQTRAVAPFKAPIDETGVHLDWTEYTDAFGNKFPDGETYSLIYPKVSVDQDAILFKDFDMSKHAAAIEATIGLYGVGLIDAISDEDLRAEYSKQQAREYCKGLIGADIEEKDPSNPFPGKHPGRFTYLLTRGTLDNGPGANAIWNITNVTRPERQYHYITDEWAKVSSQDTEIQTTLGLTETQIFDYLKSTTLPVEMTKEDYDAFMVWHRCLAVPAARNLDDSEVQHGKELFTQAGCAECHRPSWTTRSNYTPMPQMSNQKIFPYTDLLRHDLDMYEPGRCRVCRTTPLWGRGLYPTVSGHSDKLHDLRARNNVEAIMWHGGEAAPSRDAFRNMSKADRNALVKFLDAI